jgi:hypothetical protein
MQFLRLSKLLLTLLLVVSLPLRVYATPCESPTAAPHATAAHQGTVAHRGTHCEHGSPSGHGAACDCCGVAIAAAPSGWALPHDPASAALARLIGHSPILALDRLDRPPRLAA